MPLRRYSLIILTFLFAAAAMVPPAWPAQGTGLPLPRFVSLRSGEVNLRAGPGVQYPVEWVYKTRNLPIEVIAEYHTWRKVRDWQGSQGWVHQSMVSGRRTILVTGETRILRKTPAPEGEPLAQAEAGVIGHLLECPDGGWCRIQVGGFSGWLRRTEFWGTLPDEVVR